MSPPAIGPSNFRPSVSIGNSATSCSARTSRCFARCSRRIPHRSSRSIITAGGGGAFLHPTHQLLVTEDYHHLVAHFRASSGRFGEGRERARKPATRWLSGLDSNLESQRPCAKVRRHFSGLPLQRKHWWWRRPRETDLSSEHTLRPVAFRACGGASARLWRRIRRSSDGCCPPSISRAWRQTHEH